MTDLFTAAEATDTTLDGDPQFLSVHVIETLIAALPVRDENGQPKAIVLGGDLRTVVTSGSRRRAERTHMRYRAAQGKGHLAGHAMGLRTREWALITANALAARHGWDKEEALIAAKAVLQGVGLKFGDKANTANLTKVLLFAHEDAGRNIAEHLAANPDTVGPWVAEHAAAVQAAADKKAKAAASKRKSAKTSDPEDGDAPEAEEKLPTLPKAIREAVLTALAPADAMDIALYGRFLAEIADSPNVDGAVQTCHAFTVHPAEHIDDFYSSADDAKLDRTNAPKSAFDYLDQADRANTDGGAGMTGYQSLVSGTFYRQMALDRYKLRRNLTQAGLSSDQAHEAARRAEKALVEAFVDAQPRAKTNTTSSTGSLPQLVVAFDGDRPYYYGGTFTRSLADTSDQPAHLAACERLLRHHAFVAGKRNDITPARIFTYDIDVADLLTEAAADKTLPGTEVTTIEELTRP